MSSSGSNSTERQLSGAAAEVSSSGSRFSAITDSSRKYDGLVFFHHMVAGAAAGTVEHTAMFPVDTIKTRMQALSHPGQRLHTSVWGALRSALRREGVSGLYRGVGAVALGAGPAHAIHFGVYEFSKEAMGGNTGNGHHPAIAGVSGAIATIVNEAIMTPVDVIKQRLQVAHSPYRNVMHCLQQTLKNEGVGALFKSYRTTLIMNIPFQAVHFAIYEGTKKVLLEPVLWRRISSAASIIPSTSPPPSAAPSPSSAAPSTSPSPSAPSSSNGSGRGSTAAGAGPQSSGADGEGGRGERGSAQSSGAGGEGGRGVQGGAGQAASSVAELMEEEEALDDNLATQLVAGGLAGGVAAALTTPLDVVKTRLQTEGVHSALKYRGSAVLPTLRRIYQEEGAASLWRGLKPRVMFHVPAAAVCWGTYETIKSFLAASE